MADYFIVPGHFFVEFDADFENFAEILFVGVEELVHVAVADEENFYVYGDGLGLHCGGAEWKENIYRLNF